MHIQPSKPHIKITIAKRRKFGELIGDREDKGVLLLILRSSWASLNRSNAKLAGGLNFSPSVRYIILIHFKENAGSG